MPTIRVDNFVYDALKAKALEHEKPFTSPNNVLRHLLGIDDDMTARKATQRGKDRP